MARSLVSGTVNRDRLIIDADGTGANIDAAVVDQLRDYRIYAEKYQMLGAYDQHD